MYGDKNAKTTNAVIITYFDDFRFFHVSVIMYFVSEGLILIMRF